jgi:hypothetical protein
MAMPTATVESRREGAADLSAMQVRNTRPDDDTVFTTVRLIIVKIKNDATSWA